MNDSSISPEDGGFVGRMRAHLADVAAAVALSSFGVSPLALAALEADATE